MPDRHLSVVEKIWKWVNVNRVDRMNKHFFAIKSEILPKTSQEKKEVEYFSLKFKEYYRKTDRLVKMRLFLYIFLYASVIVNVLAMVPVLSFLVDFIQFGKAIVGTTLLLVVLLMVQMKINLHLELMNESLTHLIALYHKNHSRQTEKFLKNLSKTL